MARLLHMIAAPRGMESRTLKASHTYVERFQKTYPGSTVDALNLFQEKLPAIDGGITPAKYALMAGGMVPDELKSRWAVVERHIGRFLSADAYLLSTPMWNFSIPYPLKQYLDVIVQPGYLFRYGPKGVEGLVKGKSMVVVTSRGGEYFPGTPTAGFDQQEPYLRTIFGFVGITDIRFVHAQGMDMAGPVGRENKLNKAIAELAAVPMPKIQEPAGV
ncbi:MAG TPA: ACP phosphodiesterase [Elusimicrobia bacterium]|nr:ACP phosphodiesterase [Elusimicrobiota bacterium]